jgi:sialic acid synthase SpsE
MPKQIILDLGSGNTCGNDLKTIKKMIDSIPNDPRIILKWQLFKEAGNNIPLNPFCFKYAYEYAKTKGFLTTASVFDLESLKYLCRYPVPFIKLANNKDYEYLADYIPESVPIYQSWDGKRDLPDFMWEEILVCVSKYPANIDEYLNTFSIMNLYDGISDHTVGTELYKQFRPYVWEKHYKLSDSTGLDAGSFAITPDELETIL